MRRLLLSFALVVVAALGVVSCEKSDLQRGVTSGTSMLYACVADTKIEFSDNSESGISLTWEEGDAFSVYTADGGGYVGDYSCSDVASEAFTPKTSFTLDDDTDYIAIYPASTATTLEAARARDLTSEQDGDLIANLDDACYMEASFTYSDGDDQKITVAFEHQMAVMSFTFVSDERPDYLIFANGSATYSVTYSEITPADDYYYTSHIMIESCGEGERTLTFSLYDSDNNAYDIREVTTSKSYLAGVRYTAPVSDLTPWQGSGTESDPYLISTANDLRLLSTNVNAGTNYDAEMGVTYSGTYFIVTNDIALDGSQNDQHTPIGTSSYPFGGTFDGNNFTISGLYISRSEEICQGLFGYTDGATICDLAILGEIEGNNNSGGFVGYSNNTTIRNCQNSATIVGNNVGVGGIAGKAIGNSIITNCQNSGDISGGNSVGGIAGTNEGTITNCYNIGSITGESLETGVAGITALNTGTIASCYNTGTVLGISTVSGVAGQNSGTIINCYNTNTVSALYGNTTGYNFGGVAGYNELSGKVINCYNTGAIGRTTDSQKSSVGGITGDNHGSDISISYNTNDITSTESYVGGIAGNSNGTAPTIENCYNRGNISGYTTIGGIVGGAENTEIESCYSAAKTITTTASGYTAANFGAVVGENVSNKTFTDCYYEESVTFIRTNGASSLQNYTGTSTTTEVMTGGSFAVTLNKSVISTTPIWMEDYTININSGYPILSWQ